MKRLFLFSGLFYALSCVFNFVLAQNASALWPLTSTTQGAVTTTGLVAAQSQKLANTTINQYTGTDGSQRIQIAGGTWPASQTDTITGTYIQFEVAPSSGNTLNVNSIAFKIGAASGGNMRAKAFYSTDPSFKTATQITELPNANLSQTVLLSISRATDITLNEGQSLYVRIYPWYTSTSTGKYVTLKDVTLSGVTSAAGPTATAPVVTTNTSVSDITTTAATVGGNVTADGGAAVTARGVAYGTSENPTIAGDKTEDGTGTGEFTGQLNGLTPGTTYFARAYATNAAGTSYGEQVSFATLTPATVPTVTTTDVAGIMLTSALSGGNVTATGGADITVRGVVWNTTGTPTIADNKTEDGTGEGSFTSELTGLTAETTYYVRAYATNSAGTAYGDEVSFTTLEESTGTATASAAWPLTQAMELDPVSKVGKPTTSGQIVARNQRLVNMNINQYTGPNSSQRTRINSNNWPLSQTDTIAGTYVQFAVTPAANNTLLVKSIALKIAAHSTSAMKARVFYSTDRQFRTSNVTEISYSTGISNNMLSITALTAVEEATNVTVNQGDSLFVRVYPWVHNQTTTQQGKYLALQDVVITGESSPASATATVPVVTTDATVTGITLTSATVGGNVTADGGAAVTARGVAYGTSENPTIAGDKTEDGAGTGEFTGQLNGLTPGTTYFARAYATNSQGTSYGQEVSFTTLPAVASPKKVLYITQAKTTWDAAAAPVNNDAIVQMLEKDPNIDVTVRVLTSAEAGAAATAIDMAPFDVVVVQESMGGSSAILTPAGTLGLSKITKPTIYNKTYALQSSRAFAVTSPVTPGTGVDASTSGTTVGGVTTPGVPVLSMTVPTANRSNELFNGINFTDEAGTMPIFRTGATDNGGIATGTNAPKGFSYNNVVVLDPANRTLAEFPANADRSIAETGTPVFFNDVPANTTIGTETTKARMILMGMNFGAMNKDGGTNITSEGLTLWRNAIYSLAGLAVPATPVDALRTLPAVATTGVSNITDAAAQAGGNVTATGGADVTARGVVWNTTGTPTTADNKTEDGTGAGTFTSQLTSLTASTTYFVRAYATNSEGTVYGQEVTFTTLVPVTTPAVATTSLSNITPVSAQAGGDVTATGGADVTARGVVWNTTGSPTTADNKTEDGTGAGTFTSQLTGLTSGTTYYVRAYATNSAGTSYGQEVSFSTPQAPTVTTVTTATSITHNAATVAGNVTADGGSPVTAKGIVYGTSENPTINDSKTEAGAGTGEISGQLTELLPATTYYARAYATNAAGTTYGSQISFTTLSAPTSIAGETSNASFSLSQNYPNPSAGSTTIGFELKKAGYVTLEVFDITGKKVATLAEGIKAPGSYEVTVNNTLGYGVYLYKLSADGATATRKMVITR